MGVHTQTHTHTNTHARTQPGTHKSNTIPRVSGEGTRVSQVSDACGALERHQPEARLLQANVALAPSGPR